MSAIKIRFEQGEVLSAFLLKVKAPQTCELILNHLPFESAVTQSRWSGREINCRFSASSYPIRENQTIYTSIGEVCYWRDWNWEGSGDLSQAIAIYYGAELARSHRGYEPVNVFAQIDYSQLHQINKVGERIWLNGTEKVCFEKLND
ncbi:DUF3830 family protein [Aquibacillus sp. 3ASR75-11]|uniref:DUF3830 family protein n=1 Tax=Terrihalobacillus insolitus TaxID=2950438 RepID=A0A9X4AML7_9BACI|nr:DUF3830 family protein [Terrihalobacillus insolitus]MDC3425456.1 DUF3830 family protein [Terrihalobacillus insolitus]